MIRRAVQEAFTDDFYLQDHPLPPLSESSNAFSFIHTSCHHGHRHASTLMGYSGGSHGKSLLVRNGFVFIVVRAAISGMSSSARKFCRQTYAPKIISHSMIWLVVGKTSHQANDQTQPVGLEALLLFARLSLFFIRCLLCGFLLLFLILALRSCRFCYWPL